jgi:hypothetical protein
MFVNYHTVLQILLTVIFAGNPVQTILELTQFLDDVTQLSGYQAILNLSLTVERCHIPI